MGNKRFATNPLLYIQQSTVSTPVAPMQHNYHTPKHNLEISDRKGRKSTHTIPIKRIHSTIHENIADETLEEEFTEQSKFKDMTIIQKVHHFIDRPSHAPSIKCEIKTKEKKFYGVITGFEDNQVFIRVGRRSSSSEIPLTDITDIRMIGL